MSDARMSNLSVVRTKAESSPRWVPCAGEHVETTTGRWMRRETGWFPDTYRFCDGAHQRTHTKCPCQSVSVLSGHMKDCPGDGWERQAT